MKKLFVGACLLLACAASLVWVAPVGAAAGGLDAAFNPGGAGANDTVFALALQPDGKTIVGGNFSVYNGDASAPDHLIRLNADGTRDASFNPGGLGANGSVLALALQPDGKIIVAGLFTVYNGDGAAPDGLMRLNADGTRDTSFNAGGIGIMFFSGARALALQPDGKILVGGQFSSYNDDPATPDNVMRLNANGTRDTSFNAGGAGTDGVVHALAVQSDGRILVGGLFTSYNGDPAAPDNVIRLNANGTRDAAFNAGGSGADQTVQALAVQADGKVVIGGVFNAYNGALIQSVTRLNADGTRDTAFNAGGAGASGGVSALALQADGKVVVGGNFTSYNGNSALPHFVMRLNADGTPDGTFNTGGIGPDNAVFALALQADGRAVIGGNFTAYNGDAAAPNYVARLAADSNPAGGILQFSQAVYTVAERGGQVVVTVRRVGDTTQAVTVDYATDDASTPSAAAPCSATNGAALERCDYTRAAGTLRFAAGDAEETFVVLVGDDSFAEGTETTRLRLSNPTGGGVLGSPSVSTLEITDDATESAGNPIDDAQTFVRQHYHDFLNREPDAAGLAHWTGQMTNCGSPNLEVCRINVSAAFFQSIEFKETGFLVERMYKAAYGDATGTSTFGGAHTLAVPVVRLGEFLPDTQEIGRGVVVGQGNWQQQLESNKQAFALAFVRRQRFKDAFPSTMTANDFVTKLDQNAGGVLNADERAQLVAALAPDASDEARRAQVLRAVAENATFQQRETNRAFVLMQYFGYLRRNPNDAPELNRDYTGYDFWLSKLNQFNGDFVSAEMVKAFITSTEYRNRFGQ